jgi:hypothetical protein
MMSLEYILFSYGLRRGYHVCFKILQYKMKYPKIKENDELDFEDNKNPNTFFFSNNSNHTSETSV